MLQDHPRGAAVAAPQDEGQSVDEAGIPASSWFIGSDQKIGLPALSVTPFQAART